MTTRRALLLFACSCGLRADAGADVWNLCAALAAALSQGNAGGFLSLCDSSMAQYPELERNVTALLRMASVQSSIEPVSNEGDDAVRSVELDWLLVIKGQQDSITATRRQARIKVRMAKKGRRWRVKEIDRVDFFVPPRW